MKSVKILGLVLIFVGAIVLILSYFQGWVNNNLVTAGSLVAMIIGWIVYIFAGKKCLENNWLH